MVEQTTHIRIDKKLKESLDSLKGSTKNSYSDIISKYLPPKKDIWKDRLYQDFKVLEQDFPEKVSILEYMRMVIFNSMDLPKELTEKHDKEMELRLNELSHYGLELKKGEVNIGEHDVNKNLQPESVPPKGGIDLVGSEEDSNEDNKKEKVVSEALTEILQDDPNFLTSEVEDPVFILQSKLGEKLGEESIEIDEETISKVLESERKQNGGVFE